MTKKKHNGGKMDKNGGEKRWWEKGCENNSLKIVIISDNFEGKI